jgi:hypothetical protein
VRAGQRGDDGSDGKLAGFIGFASVIFGFWGNYFLRGLFLPTDRNADKVPAWLKTLEELNRHEKDSSCSTARSNTAACGILCAGCDPHWAAAAGS